MSQMPCHDVFVIWVFRSSLGTAGIQPTRRFLHWHEHQWRKHASIGNSFRHGPELWWRSGKLEWRDLGQSAVKGCVWWVEP